MRILDKDRFRRFTGVQLVDLVLISEDYLDFCIESIDILRLGWIWLGIWLLTFLDDIAFFRRNEATLSPQQALAGHRTGKYPDNRRNMIGRHNPEGGMGEITGRSLDW